MLCNYRSLRLPPLHATEACVCGLLPMLAFVVPHAACSKCTVCSCVHLRPVRHTVSQSGGVPDVALPFPHVALNAVGPCQVCALPT